LKHCISILLVILLSTSVSAQKRTDSDVPWKSGSIIHRSADLISKSKIQKKYKESGNTIPLREGWPVKVSDAPRFPVAADLTDDGTKEVIIADRDGWLHVLTCDGAYLSSVWPMKLGTELSSPAIADIDQDGELEIIVVARSDWEKNWPNGWVHVLKINGEYLPGWPYMLDGGHRYINSVSIGDINRDGRLNIITATGSTYADTNGISHHFDKLYVLNGDGTTLSNWPVRPDSGSGLDRVPRSPLVLADLNHDMNLEVIAGFFSKAQPEDDVHTIYAVNYEGNTLDGFPVVTRDWNYALASADMDNDGYYEIYCHGQKFDRFGNEDTNWKRQEGVISPLAFADVNDDGYPELIYGWGEVFVVDRYGNVLPGWPQDTGTWGDGTPVAGDIDGDGDIEILIGSTGTDKIFAWHHDGVSVSGFPLTTGGSNRRLAISDLDGDGSIELISACMDDYIYVWNIPSEGPCTRLEWPMYQHDQYHTGVYPSKHGTPVIEEPGKAVGVFRLEQNYPNPFNPSTEIRFVLTKASKVNLSVYNTLGQQIRILASGFMPSGSHTAVWDGRDEQGSLVPSGVYVCRLRAEGEVVTKKLTLMR